MTGGLQFLTAVGPAPVLPDKRWMDRPARFAVPGNDGFPLVGDSDRRQVPAVDAGASQSAEGHRAGHLPDLARVVLNPSRLGEALVELGVSATRNIAAFIEDKAGGAGGALIDSEDHRRLR